MRPVLHFFFASLLAATPPLRAQSAETRSVMNVRVAGTSNPYLAGRTVGASTYHDHAPEESPALVGLYLGNAAYVTFSANGGVQHHPFWPAQFDPPMGAAPVTHAEEHGISKTTAPIDSLLGVFLGDDPPDGSPSPPPLDYRKVYSAVSVEPQLKQVFYIGFGTVRARAEGSAKKTTVPRQYLVPKGATRLYLATMDEYEWNNNEGFFYVTVTVERTEAASQMFNVDSTISFAKWACMPDRSECTPERGTAEANGSGQYHVVLPAHLEWGVSMPNPERRKVSVRNVTGVVCLDEQSRSTSMCNGPSGNGQRASGDFLLPGGAMGALVSKTAGGRTYFSVNGQSGASFQ